LKKAAKLLLFTIQVFQGAPEFLARRRRCILLHLPAAGTVILTLRILHALALGDVSVTDRAEFPLRISDRHADNGAALFTSAQFPTRRIRKVRDMLAARAWDFDRHRDKT
jgi:hypothetical protein